MFSKTELLLTFAKKLDAEMKRLKQTGLGSKAKQTEPLTEAEEEIL